MQKKERIDKIISSQGLVSRSEMKAMIKRGEVSLNGVVVKDSGIKAGYDDEIIINGQRLFQTKYTYIMLNKPLGYVTTTSVISPFSFVTGTKTGLTKPR